jgi:glycosyltransferase involved in cell wall biosynthesis
VVDGKHLLIADDEADFSQRVIELLRDPEGAQVLAASGRTRVEEKYSWATIIGGLEPKLADLVRRTGGTAQEGMRHATLQG